MQRSWVASLALVALALPLVGCNKVQARVELKKGNEEYHNEQYRRAMEQYQKGLKLDPDATFAWRSVGLSALALYKPADKSRQNQELADLAIESFKNYLADYPDDEKVREYLMTMYVNDERYDDALAFLENEAKARPENAASLDATRVRLLVQAGRLQQAWQLAQSLQGPAAAESLYSIGVSAWDKSYRDPSLNHEQRTQVVDMGLQAMDRALRLRPEYFDAMVYNNLLFREKAKLQTDGNLRLEYVAKADEWQAKARELRKKIQAQEKAEQEKANAGHGGSAETK